MNKDPKYAVKRIINGIERVEEYTKGKTREEFLESSQIQEAVAHRLKIISDAAREIPMEFKEKNDGVPWYKITETLDQLAYQSLGIRLVQTWIVVRNDLPMSKEKILKIYEK